MSSLLEYAKQSILEASESKSIIFYSGNLQDFIEAAEALNLRYHHLEGDRGYCFSVYDPKDEDISRGADIILNSSEARY